MPILKSLHGVGDVIVLDVETTGLNPATDRVVSLTALKVPFAKYVAEHGAEINHFSCLVYPQRRIPLDASLVHGIYDDDVMDAVHFSEIANDLIEFIGDDLIIGHNVSFDISFLSHECRKCLKRNPFSRATSYCTSMALERQHGRRISLSDAAIMYGIPGRKRHWHNAMEDALITLQLAASIMLMEKGQFSKIEPTPVMRSFSSSCSRHAPLLSRREEKEQERTTLVSNSFWEWVPTLVFCVLVTAGIGALYFYR